MKNILTTFLVASSLFTIAQVQIDKDIQLNGTAGNRDINGAETIDVSVGYKFNNSVGSAGQVLRSDAINGFVAGSIVAGDLPSGSGHYIWNGTTLQTGDFRLSGNGSVGTLGIGIATPNASAILDIIAGNKGVSFPNVDLQSNTDATTIALPKRGLLVYNTGVTLTPSGLYVNMGIPGSPNWLKLSDASGTVSSISAVTPLQNTGTASNAVIELTGILPIANGGTGNATGTATINANLTGMVTSVGNATTVVTNANLTGEVTSVGNAATLTNAAVIGKVLTGYTSSAGTIVATDNILQAIQKLNGNNATNADLTGHITSTGNATLLGSFSSSNLLTAVSDETGTGVAVFGTAPTFTTNITTPLLIGGTAVGSTIIYKSTTGVGTATGIAHQFIGGTDGATVAQTILNNGSVGIGTTIPNTKARVDITSTTQGFLPPRMTSTERTAIAGLVVADKGLMVFDTTLNWNYVWSGSRWVAYGAYTETLTFCGSGF